MAAALVLLLAMAAGLGRVIVGPSAADRMMGAQLLGTMGIGVLLLLAFAFERDALTDVALIFGLLASVAAVALTRRRIGQDQD